MCITFVTSESNIPYDMDRPLEDQLVDCKEIMIDFKPKDPSVEKFLGEIERFVSHGIAHTLNIKLLHNNHVSGAKAKKRAKKAQSGLTANDLIKMMVRNYDITDRKLEELSSFCMGKDCVK